MKQCEIFRITGCVEPFRVGGPYSDYSALLAAARKAHAESKAEDVLLYAEIDDAGRPALSPFSTAELEIDAELGDVLTSSRQAANCAHGQDPEEYQRDRLSSAEIAYVVRLGGPDTWAVYVPMTRGGSEFAVLWGTDGPGGCLPHQRMRRDDEDPRKWPSFFFDGSAENVEASLRTVNPEIKVTFLEGWRPGNAEGGDADDPRTVYPMTLNPNTGDVEVVIYEANDPRDLLEFFCEELPRESGVDDGSDGMEVGIWYGFEQRDDFASSNWAEMEDGRIVPLLQRLATPDAQMITEDGRRWELMLLENIVRRKWQLIRRHRVGSALWRIEKSDDQGTNPWKAYPPDEVDVTAVDGLTKDAWNWLTRNDAFFGRFEYAARIALREFVAKDLVDDDAQAVNEIVDEARDELGIAAKVAMRRTFLRILEHFHKGGEGGGDRIKQAIGTKETT